ncbi:hypothetical protein QQ045_011724 [Rhodiola kirilowii]
MSNITDSNQQDVAVTTTGMTVVTADSALVQDHREPLSYLDLYIPKEDVVVILCYEKPNVGFESTLVSNDSSGEIEISCNNRGVDFTEASINLDLSELDLHKPDAVIGEKLAPKLERGTLAVQVTEFQKCWSVVVACKFDHTVADAYAMNIFLVSWSEKALSKPLSFPPSRLIFKHRSPLRYGPELSQLFSLMSSLPPPFISNNSRISRMYYITADQTVAVQNAVSTETSNRTKLESFSAFLWKLLAKCACQESTENKELITKMAIVVDGRSRLASVYDHQACATYFGNVISIPYGSETEEIIMNKPLTWVGERVAEIVKAGANTDRFLDMIDLAEETRRADDIAIPTGFWPKSSDGSKVCVSSGLRFPVGKLDFGWGRPVLGFYYLPWKFDFGYVMPVPHPAGNGDWIVYMYIPKEQLEFIEKEAPYVFRPCSLSQLCSKSRNIGSTSTLTSSSIQKASGLHHTTT